MNQKEMFPGRKNRETKSAEKFAKVVEAAMNAGPQWPTRSQVNLPDLGGMVELVYEGDK